MSATKCTVNYQKNNNFGTAVNIYTQQIDMKQNNCKTIQVPQ